MAADSAETGNEDADGPLVLTRARLLDGSLWGAAFEHGRGALVAGGAGAGAGVGPLEFADEGGGWRLRGDGTSLVVTPRIAPEPAADPPVPGARAVPGEGPELCRVQGSLTVGGAQVTCDLSGIRVAVPAPSSARAAWGSARLVGTWLPDGAAVGLLAARSTRATDQAGDQVVATLFDPEAWTAVTEPRLSTTYGADGAPARCNLELWISDGEDEFPRRAAGEVSAGCATISDERFTLWAAPLRSHSRGEDGAGVYAVADFS